MSYKVTTAPATEPITLTEAKSHLRITHPDEDTYITALIKDCRDYCEQYLDLALIEQTITLYCDQFPSVGSYQYDLIMLPMTNLLSVTSVKYTNESDVLTTVATTVYATDTSGRVGKIYLKDGEVWPTDEAAERNTVEIVYKAGYGATGASTPEAIKRAIYLLLSHWYANREAAVVGVSVADLPLGVESALNRHRVYGL